MVKQIEINQFSNAFDYCQYLIKELKNQSLTISQRLEEPMVGQAKTMAKEVQQTKDIVKGLEQRSQSQVKLLETILGVVSRPTR